MFSLNFHVIIQVICEMHTKSIQKQIVEYDIKIKYPEEYLTVDIGRSEKRSASASCHVRPWLYNLHWLSVKFRIDFKTLLLTYKAVA